MHLENNSRIGDIRDIDAEIEKINMRPLPAAFKTRSAKTSEAGFPMERKPIPMYHPGMNHPGMMMHPGMPMPHHPAMGLPYPSAKLFHPSLSTVSLSEMPSSGRSSFSQHHPGFVHAPPPRMGMNLGSVPMLA